LQDVGTVQLASTVKKRCTDIPKAWPEVETSQAQAEGLIQRDQRDTVNCANAALSYVGHVEKRDKALMLKK